MSNIERILDQIQHTVAAEGRAVLSRVLTVLTELVTDRGCTHISVTQSPLENIAAGSPVVETDELDVYVHNEERIGVKAVRAVVQAAPAKAILWVSADGPTSVARKEAAVLNVQFMPLKTVCYNISRHVLVPKHVAVPRNEELHKFLPKLPENDPVVGYYGWPVGTTVEITRNWGGSEPTTYLRVVSPAER